MYTLYIILCAVGGGISGWFIRPFYLSMIGSCVWWAILSLIFYGSGILPV